MKEYASEQLRNVALAGNSGAGKTSLAEAMLFVNKAIDRQGRVEDGNTTSDYDPEENKRQISINATLLPIEAKTEKINLLDLPGVSDFIGDIKSCMRVADSVLLVVDAVAPMGGGLEFAWSHAEEFGLPRVVFINKMDKERADFHKAIDALRQEFAANFVPVVLPIGAESGFSGVVDLLRMKAVKDAAGAAKLEDIPADMADAVEEARMAVVEAAAEGDDSLLEKFLGDEALSPEEVAAGLRAAIAEARFVPVLCGSSATNVGISALTDFIKSSLPSPLQGPGLTLKNGESQKVDPAKTFSAFVFKSVSDDFAGKLNFFKVMTGSLASDSQIQNVTKDKGERIGHILSLCGKKSSNVDKLNAGDIGAVSKLAITGTNDTLAADGNQPQYAPTPLPRPNCEMAISSTSKTDEEKVGMGLHRLCEQDPTLIVRRDSATSQTLLAGMGETQLDVAVARLKAQAKVDVELSIPRVSYKETITKAGEAQGKYKKQSGGRGQYGDCHLRLEPAERGEGFSFTWAIVGGVIPTKYAPAVEKGLIEALEKGFLSGSPMVDVKASCFDGSYHNVDSSEMAFKVAASMAFKNAAPKCNPIILEPICNVTVSTPEAYMGDVMGDLNGKRGRILGMEREGKRQVIRAQVPQSEMYTFSRDLRSITQGRGTFEMEFSHYDPVPHEEQLRIVEEAAKRKTEEDEA
ncbi:MAG: Elongation factor G [candidate division BRC1 bacterium ADurb.BinA364]|nr:MAG: Elongation factor G [candidate division BRC1 bacterium ADurb.BinA364]